MTTRILGIVVRRHSSQRLDAGTNISDRIQFVSTSGFAVSIELESFVLGQQSPQRPFLTILKQIQSDLELP
jgi:hypothetical protein